MLCTKQHRAGKTFAAGFQVCFLFRRPKQFSDVVSVITLNVCKQTGLLKKL